MCNSGVSLTPTINGQTFHFVVAGLYDGLFVMKDDKTSTLWNHVTGEGMYGEHAGTQMPVGNLLQMNADQAVKMDANMRVAISDRTFSLDGRRSRFKDPDRKLRPMFIETLGEDDVRRPRMDMGLGVWSESTHRYYPVATIRSRGDYILDEFDGEKILIYLDPVTSTPQGIFVAAQEVSFQDNAIVLDGGRKIVSGQLYGAHGEATPVKRPLQMFTRWYGFSLTFPNPDIFE